MQYTHIYLDTWIQIVQRSMLLICCLTDLLSKSTDLFFAVKMCNSCRICLARLNLAYIGVYIVLTIF